MFENDKVVGVKAGGDGEGQVIHSRLGVVLACGGFPHDVKRIAQAYAHLKGGGDHLSPTPKSNTGDGVRMAESLGADAGIRFNDSAAWMPVSKVDYGNGEIGVFPHLLDRYKPGVIGVMRNGKRFANESNSYHDVGVDMIRASEGRKETVMWLVCDKTTLGKYGLGFVKPAPMPIGKFIRNGYLLSGNTLAELAQTAGIDAQALEETVREYNLGAIEGNDLQYGRGTTAFNRYLADPEQGPNPCVAPILSGPYYAVKVVMGDLGTFDGIQTSVLGEVKKQDGSVINGLYAVGNDRSSIMGGKYPAAGITHGPNMTFGYVTGNHLADLAGVQ